MKKTYGLILATMLSTAVMAQVATNEPAPASIPAAPDAGVAAAPVMPPETGATNATGTAKSKAKKTTKKKTTVAKKKSGLPTSPVMAPASPLVTNEPAIALPNNVNIRGQAHINSEVVGHLKKGDTVTVLELITLKHPKTDEPANWARIALPSNVHVWVNTHYLDLLNNLVSARKVNIRTGAGENYSVIGMLQKGDAIKQVGTKGDWSEIETPTNAFGFVAAHLLSHVEAAPAPVPVVSTPTPAPTPTPTTTIVDNSTPIAPATDVPGTTASPTAPIATTPPPPPVPVAPPVPVVEEPLPKRIVQREGIVGGTASIQAPSHYELRSLENGEVMDYLYTTSTNVPMKLYKGLTVYVTGEEELDERWPNTPVITIQKIQVVK